MSSPGESSGGLERRICAVLAPLAPVRPDDLPRLATAALAQFLLMASYYVLKPIRGSTFIDQWGADWLPPFYVLIAVVTFATASLYNRLVERFERRQIMDRVYGATAAVFTLVWAVARLGLWPLATTTVVFVLVCVYILILTSLFWSLTHDIFTPDEGARCYGLIFLAGQGGVSLGGRVARDLAQPLGTMNLIPVSLAILGLAWYGMRALQGFEVKVAAKATPRPQGTWGDLRALGTHPYARRIGLLVILSMLAVTCVDFQFNKMLESGIPSLDARTSYLGACFSWAGLLTAVLLVAAGRVVSRFGPAAALVVLPLVTLAAGLNYLRGTALDAAAWLWLASHSTNYSLYNVGKEVLYVPCDRLVKYKFKALNDAVGYRVGDATAALLIVGYRVLVSPTSLGGLALVLFVLAPPWLALIRRAGSAWREAAVSA